jgi:hypothetical protein
MYYRLIILIFFIFPENTSASIFNAQKDTSFYTESMKWSFQSIEFTKDTKHFLDSLVSSSVRKKYKSINIILLEYINIEASSILIYRRAKYIEDFIRLNYPKLTNLSITVSTKLLNDERDINFNIIGISKERILHKFHHNSTIILVSLSNIQ